MVQEYSGRRGEKREHKEQGFGGRFGAGLPRINDGSPLFDEIEADLKKIEKEIADMLAEVTE